MGAADSLELALPNADCFLSARRLWEHCVRGQANVFGRELSGEPGIDDPVDFIDVLQTDSGGCVLIGGTLAEMTDGRPTAVLRWTLVTWSKILLSLVGRLTARRLFRRRPPN